MREENGRENERGAENKEVEGKRREGR